MDVRIRRIDKELPLPRYATEGSVAFDLSAREAITVPPKTIAYVPLNICVETPSPHLLLLAARSSLHKRGLMLPNGIGIVDQDFSGNGDECKAALYNFTDEPAMIPRGERIVQATFITFNRANWQEVDDLSNRDRGGFGSTGAV